MAIRKIEKKLFCLYCKKRTKFVADKPIRHGNKEAVFLQCSQCKRHETNPYALLDRQNNEHHRVISSFIILLILIIGCSKQPVQIEPEFDLTFKLKPPNIMNYVLELNNSEIRSGVLETSWNDIKVRNLAGNYRIYYFDDNHYVNYIDEVNYDFKKNKVITRELEFKDKKGIINVSLGSSIEPDKEQSINLVFEANGTIKHISYCLFRTIGIVSAKPERDISICDTGAWTNTTSKGNLSDGKYYCDGLVASCDSVTGRVCDNRELGILDVEADECYFLGKTLVDEKYEIPLNIKTKDYYDNTDYLKIFVFDMDLTKKERVFGEWSYDFELIFELGLS